MNDIDEQQQLPSQDASAEAQTTELSPLEEEGEIAADYIEELLDTADIDLSLIHI